MRYCDDCWQWLECHPWGDPAEWRCDACFTHFFIDDSLTVLKNMLTPLRPLPEAPVGLPDILGNYELGYLLVSFLEP